ncbi:MAG: CTB family bacteriocin [Cyanobacteria bacterium J06641_2]
MSNEFNNVNAIELSEQELDVVAGGSIDSFDSFGFGLNGSVFKKFAVKSGESTFAGPEGTGSQHIFEAQGISTGSFKGGIGGFGKDTSYESYE